MHLISTNIDVSCSRESKSHVRLTQTDLLKKYTTVPSISYRLRKIYWSLFRNALKRSSSSSGHKKPLSTLPSSSWIDLATPLISRVYKKQGSAWESTLISLPYKLFGSWLNAVNWRFCLSLFLILIAAYILDLIARLILCVSIANFLFTARQLHEMTNGIHKVHCTSVTCFDNDRPFD